MPEINRFLSQPRVMLPGSEREPFTPGRHRLPAKVASAGSAAPATEITVSVILRPREPLPAVSRDGGQSMSREDFAERHGADPESSALVGDFAGAFGLKVLPGLGDGRRTLQLQGTIAQLERAFDVRLTERDSSAGRLRLREGAIYLPEELSGHVLAVLGLDDRPQARSHLRIAKPNAVSVSYTPVQVAQLYGFPAGVSAAGQTIGLIELGGGYREADLTAYFKGLGLPAPAVTAVPVDGGANTPGDANGADGEVMLDIEVAAAVAPGVKIAVYFAPNTDQGFVDAISTAVHDQVNAPSVISISWGGPENSWSQQATQALDQACRAAAVLGVTITAAAGDSGSGDGSQDGSAQVDFPASSPHVLACGGTRLTGTADTSGATIANEVVWNETASGQGATGGGVSTLFPLPTWQQTAGVPALPSGATGRGVPDVAGDADPATGYVIRVDGQTATIGGTSAVAPLWAGLIALANAANGRHAGFVNPQIYTSAGTEAFRDIVSGNNGAYAAGPGWDACTGLGSPVGTGVVALLGAGGGGAPTPGSAGA